jgi:hypothetical protein
VADSIIILNKSFEENSFLNFQLGIASLENLFIGKQSYLEKIKNIFLDSEKRKFIITDIDCKSFLDLKEILQKDENYQSQFNPEDEIIYYDLKLYPKDPFVIQNVFQKVKYTDDICLFFETNNSKKTYLPIFKLKASYLFDQFYNQSSIYSATNAMEVDLSQEFMSMTDTASVLQLFSSNFDLRYFNHLKSQEDFFVKSSTNKEKMQAEHNFLSVVPSDLKPFYPQVGEYSDDLNLASYQIEKIYILDLSKHLVNRVLDTKKLDNFFSKLKVYFSKLSQEKVSREEYQNSLRKDFILKNHQRFDQLKTLEIYSSLNLIAKLYGLDSIDSFFGNLQQDLNNYIDSVKNTLLHFSHGDMCFSNILFDNHTRSIKFIDPKGFNLDKKETFRSMYYDLAKLSHSCLGLYDLIVNDLITINLENQAKPVIKYCLDDDYLQKISDAFKNFVNDLGYDLSVVRLFEASLFLSMIPLHQDGEKKMIAQFVQAINSYEEAKNLAKKTKILG